MFFFLFFIIELICLFFLSRLLTQLLSRFLLHMTRSHHSTIHILSFLFFPGVMIHELSHMFMAAMLFVRVGHVEFLPKIHENSVKLGSVQIAKTDPFRRFLIGAAPLFGGIGIMLLFFFYLSPYFSNPFSWQIFFFLYTLFEVCNTMFSSKKDMEGALVLFCALGFLAIGLFFLGLRFDAYLFHVLSSESVSLFFQKLDVILLFPLVLNSLFCVGINYFLKKIRRHH